MGRNQKNTKHEKAPARGGTAPAGESSTSANRTTGEKKESKFFVGLDFGTTFTSVAFAHSERPTEMKLVDTWPDAAIGSNHAEQVPTKVEYTALGMRWGYEAQDVAINPVSKPLEWFKLLLQEQDATLPVSQNRSRHAGGQVTAVSEVNEVPDGLNISPWETAEEETPEKKTKKILDELNITTVTLIADFLRKIKETTLATIKRTYWMQSGIGVKTAWILAVPTIWNNAARSSMIRAARQAGLGERGVDFELISEPECVATYSLNVIQPNDLSPGDVFVICDVGGGTADLISYKITANQPLRVDEVVPATGALCGSVSLDRRFRKYIRRTLGNKFFDSMKPRPKACMIRYWEETVKLKFGNGTKRGTYEVIVPGVDNNEKLNVEDGYHSMKYEDVKAIFDPTVDEIIHLVSQQVSKVKEKGENVKAILLVGGFGSSEYLHYRLSNHTIKRVCTLNADLSSIPRHKYTTLHTPIGDYMVITYEHRMTLVDEVWKFELFFEGKRYGVVEAHWHSLLRSMQGRRIVNDVLALLREGLY